MLHTQVMKPAQMEITNIDSLSSDADCLYNFDQAMAAIDAMAREININYGYTKITALSVMKGGAVITGQLLPLLKMPLELDFIHVSRYRDQLTGSDSLNWYVEPKQDLTGHHVLVIDDIFDEGKTLVELVKELKQRGVATVKSAVLANKIHDRKTDQYTPDFIALTLPDRYVFGLGMDRKGLLRNAPGIYALKGE